MIRRPPRSTHCISSAASDVYKRQQVKQSQQYNSILSLPSIKGQQQSQSNLQNKQKSKQSLIINRPSSVKLKQKRLELHKSQVNLQACLLYTSPSPRDQA
eukprot:TRINITY_DN9095_c0_g1_i3.p1 TRINITY_DN9095_c0_g1~~TRINITY_DN9095_c0_g1_i3.p1  ORF type:complete len:100 (+),score=26.94 TRINITY_DN9095_c0_g1_i3:133-432(+)